MEREGGEGMERERERERGGGGNGARGRQHRTSPETKLEVELKGGHTRRSLPLLVVEGDSKLNQFQEIDVRLQQLVLVVGSTLKVSDRLGHYPRELCVLEGREGGRERMNGGSTAITLYTLMSLLSTGTNSCKYSQFVTAKCLTHSIH